MVVGGPSGQIDDRPVSILIKTAQGLIYKYYEQILPQLSLRSGDDPVTVTLRRRHCTTALHSDRIAFMQVMAPSCSIDPHRHPLLQFRVLQLEEDLSIPLEFFGRTNRSLFPPQPQKFSQFGGFQSLPQLPQSDPLSLGVSQLQSFLRPPPLCSTSPFIRSHTALNLGL